MKNGFFAVSFFPENEIIMNALNKTKQQLLNEIQELRKEQDALKAFYEKFSIENKHTEEGLSESEENFRSIFENNSAAMALIEPDTTMSMVNEEYCRLSGYTKQEVIGTSWTKQIPPQDLELMKEYNRRRLINPKDAPDKYEFTFYQKNGNIRHALMSITMLSNRKIITSFVDITERKQSEMALLETESSLNAIFNAADDSIFLLSADETCIEVNEIGAKRLGRTREQTIGCRLADVLPPEIEAHRRPFLNRALLDGKKVNFEDERNGRWMVNNFYPILNNDGQVVRLAIYSRDITERKQAENALRESEESFRVLFEGSSQGILATDIETHRFLFSNPAICQMFGYSGEEFQRLSVTDLHPKESLDSLMKEVEFQKRGEEPISIAVPCLRKDGTVFYADIAGASTTVNGRKCIVGFFLDVTERKLAEDALKESEQKYRNIFENIQNVYYETSMDGTILEISPAIYILSKRLYRREDLLGQNMFKFYSDPEMRKILLQELQKMERLEDFDIELKNQDGSLTQVALTCRLIRDENKQPKKIIGSMRNITERKQFEMELIIAKERAEESDRLKSVFLANMSHEIRTPMNGILGFAELLKEPHLTDGEQQQYISIIEKSGKRMLNIIGDIVSISKIESGQMETIISETNINEQIEYIYTFFNPEAEKKGLQLLIKNTLPSKESIIKTDYEKLYAILTSLVGNAIKFTQTGSIELGVEKKGNYLEFFVKDSGEGIRHEVKTVIFERFRQDIDFKSRFNEGAGLGLSISKAYVEMLGGKIWLESEIGKGSTFYFTLPYIAESEANVVSKVVPSGIGADKQVNKLKILIAEDDETSESFLSIVLKVYCREILKAGTGDEAVEACRNNPDIDLVLMDVRMPKMNGYEATHQIRQFNKNVVIIAQTAYGLAGDREKAIDAGCNDYISKPFNKAILTALNQKHFSR